MDQVERALLVASGDAASGKLVADSHVRHCCCTIFFLFCPPVVWCLVAFTKMSGCLTKLSGCLVRVEIADSRGGLSAAVVLA